MRFLILILALLISSCSNNDGMCHRSSYVISKSNAAEIDTLTEPPADDL